MTGLAANDAFAHLIADSFARLVGRPLLEGVTTPGAATLYDAAPCLLAHDGAVDPRFIYANRAAQARFGYGWEAFVGLPSRLSAEAPDRAERQRLLDAVARDGFIADYRGIRIAATGQRFWIEEAIVWTLRDAAGLVHGQAAVFSRTRDI